MKLIPTTALVLAAADAVSGQTTWTDAAEARAKMEEIIRAQAKFLQNDYRSIVDLEEVGSCSAYSFCDANADAWDDCGEGADRCGTLPQFLDADGTCVALDRNSAGNFLDTPVTGRVNTGSTYSNCDADSSNSDDCVCKWSAVEEGSSSGTNVESWVYTENNAANEMSKQEVLEDQECTDSSDLTKCYVNYDPDEFGYSFPDDTSYALDDDRVRAEICTTNDLIDGVDDGYSVSQVMGDYPQTAWSWLGMQETGLYRTWPGLYQCRTENQCSGCSDPRFRGWYASAASSSKDVVIIIDTSGSMGTPSGRDSNGDTQTRLTHVKTAAKWVINTLSAADFATVVEFNSDATAASSTLLPMNAVNKAKLKDWISDLSANGNTMMDLAFEEAFSVLGDSTEVGVSTSGCTQNILFLTDGQNSGADGDVFDAIEQYNGGPYDDQDLHFETGATGEGLTLISTYTFGDSEVSTSLMSKIACSNGGVFHNIGDDDAVHLKEVMGNYYTYMATGMVGECDATDPECACYDSDEGDCELPVRWVDQFEDGQGRGQETGVCAPVYNWRTSPPELFGVVCLGIWWEDWAGLTGADDEWANIQEDQAVCHDLFLTWDELESLRAKKIGSKQYTSTCASVAESEIDAVLVGAIVGGTIGGLIFAYGFYKVFGKKKEPQNNYAGSQAGVNMSSVPVAMPVQQPRQAPPAYSGHNQY